MKVWIGFQILWCGLVMIVSGFTAVHAHNYYTKKAVADASGRFRISTECMQGKVPGCATGDTVDHFTQVFLPTFSWWGGVVAGGIACLILLRNYLGPAMARVEQLEFLKKQP